MEFITNQEKLLSDVVNNILPSSEKLYFLVGYFYFSGFEEIYKNVTDKEIKILVGLEIEKDEIVYDLYGLTKKEIEIVEGAINGKK
jgi:hypothetical protein